MPMKITFKCMDSSEYVAIFKVGDDLRQDQLVLQLILLMDRLLKKEHLDLKLTPYKVLATSLTNGIFVMIHC
jgi:phosphatidylinositol 3-kinase